MTQKKYRYALIGCGFFAQNHLHAWRQNPDVELIATCDVDFEKAKLAAANFGGKAYASAEELFANEDLDFVDIATTPPTHKYMVELAAKYGVAAICQKPLAWDMADAKSMVKAMSDKGLPFMVHENFRFQTPMRKIKEIIDSGAIGRPFFGRISFRTAHDVYSAQSWLVESERMIIVDVAVHLFDLARYFIGEPKTIFTSAHRVNPIIKGEDSATILMHMEDATCIVDASYETKSDHNTYPQTFVIIEGTKGKMMCSTYGANPLLLPTSKTKDITVKESLYRVPGGDRGHYDNWVNACIAGFGSTEFKQLSSPFSIAGPLTESVLMGNLAIRSYDYQVPRAGNANQLDYPGRGIKLLWDGPNMKITNFEPANQFVTRNYRPGYTL